MKFVLCFIIIAKALFLCRAMDPVEPESTDISRQSERIQILKYTLLLQVDLKNTLFYYAATVRIQFECIKETDVIFLSRKQLYTGDNILHLDIETKSSDKGKHLEIVEKDYLDRNRKLFPIRFNRLLEEGGIYELRVGFNKPTEYKFSPIIRYSYIRDNREKTLAVTNSGVADAKELFFCFDDINMKAQFEVHILHLRTAKCFSNMPSKLKPLSESWIEDEFQDSDLMPPFSFGFVIGELESKEYTDSSVPTVIRVSSDESVMEQMNFAGEMALKIFLFYTEYLEFNYALEKLDLIALPDYDRLGRENLGLITMGEAYVLNPNSSALISKTNIILRLCDAIVHQWIGFQRITFQLNEYWFSKGLILFFQAECLNKMSPETGVQFWNSFMVKSFVRTLDLSAETSSRPVSVSLEKVNLNTLFVDTKLAEKGHHVIRLMNFVVGSPFRLKIIEFFKTHQLVNTNLEEVWKIFDPEREENSQPSNTKTIKEIMEPWLTKNGFPVVTVKKVWKKIILKQKRFMLLGDTYRKNDRDKHWKFPFSYTTKSERDFNDIKIDYWLESEEGTIKLKKTIKWSDWIIFTGNLNVLCRINYGKKNWKSLQKTLLKKKEYSWIPPEARARLLLDMFALAENGTFENSYKLPLKTIKYLDHEDSHLVWLAAMHEVNKIHRRLRDTEELKVFKEYIRGILKPVFERDLFETITHIPDDDDEKNFKKLMITSACNVGVTSCVQQCQALFNEWMDNVKNGDNINPIPQPIRDVVSCQAIKHGGRDEWNFLWKEKGKEKDLLAVKEMYEALGCTNNLDRLEDYMDYWVDKEEILERDVITVFNSFLSSEAGYLRIKKVFIESVIDIITNHGFETIFYLVKILELTKNSTDMDDLIHEALSRTNPDIDNYVKIMAALDEGSKKAKRNIKWLEEHRSTFTNI